MAQDTITGTSGPDTLRETQVIGEKNKGDTLIGLAGDDTYFWDASTWFDPGFPSLGIPGRDVAYRTKIIEQPGEGFDTATLRITFPSLAIGADEVANVERVILTNLFGATQQIFLTLDEKATEVIGAGARDTVTGKGGNDIFDGGGNEDASVYSGSRSSYAIVNFDGTTIVSGGADGTDLLRNVEILRFTDGPIAPPVARSPLEYIASYPDLRAALGADAAAGVAHFLGTGAGEGRLITFSGLAYIASYPDLIAFVGPDAGRGAAHYIAAGAAEGRQVRFDGISYIAANPDLITALGFNSLAGADHYIRAGAGEGRPLAFDAMRYIASYPDLTQAFGADAGAGLAHYVKNGHAEGRQLTFDGLAYIASYADLQDAFGTDATAAIQHYVAAGFAEGRRVSFDPLQYIAANPDLIAAFGTDTAAALQHYLAIGRFGNRPTGFDGGAYVYLHNDLLSAAPAVGYESWGTQHYIRNGFEEGRLQRDSDYLPGNQVLIGNATAERLFGGQGDDVLEGKGNFDYLIGGPGADRFVYNLASDTSQQVVRGTPLFDVIVDFRRGEGDRIDFSGLATGTAGSTFTFVTDPAGITSAGRVTWDDGWVLGNNDADTAPDFAIEVLGGPLVAADFIL